MAKLQATTIEILKKTRQVLTEVFNEVVNANEFSEDWEVSIFKKVGKKR